MRRRLTFVAIAAALVLGTGCRKPSATDTHDGKPPSGAGSQSQNVQVLATVGDRTLTVADFMAAYQHLDSFDRQRYQAPERRKALLSEMIDVMLLADEARARGYDHEPQAEQETREILRDALLKEARAALPGPNEIPAADVRAYYTAHRGDFRDPERRRVSAIVLGTEGAATAALDALRRNPAAWGDLVRARSLHARAHADVPPELAGDLGFVAPPGDARGGNSEVPDAVRVAVFQVANVGDFAPHPVSVDGKWYVIKLASRTDAHDRSFEDAERSIRVKLAQDLARATEEELVQRLKTETPVAVDETALDQVRVEVDGGRRDD